MAKTRKIIDKTVEYVNLLIEEFVPPEEEEFIAPKVTGTWIADGNTYANRWIFRRSGMIEKYYEGVIYKMYHYEIREPSDPEESNLKELVLANINNPGTEIEFQISVLTSEKLVLLYHNGVDESERIFDRF